jgi:hypothetical protein
MVEEVGGEGKEFGSGGGVFEDEVCDLIKTGSFVFGKGIDAGLYFLIVGEGRE